VPVGILVGRVQVLREVTNIPFQFLRMISPLSWMPIAVMAFATWDGAIVFLITVAAIWPILFSTAAGLRGSIRPGSRSPAISGRAPGTCCSSSSCRRSARTS
jgi:ABC-type nitrate/sulfonate/bicarbonate transport system permease component